MAGPVLVRVDETNNDHGGMIMPTQDELNAALRDPDATTVATALGYLDQAMMVLRQNDGPLSLRLLATLLSIKGALVGQDMAGFESICQACALAAENYLAQANQSPSGH
jgi:hypothetical protein